MMSQLVLQAYIESETEEILDQCITCGKCVEVCPMLPYGNLQGADPKHVVSGILDILRGGQGRYPFEVKNFTSVLAEALGRNFLPLCQGWLGIA
jgi:Fe-S oxidoreductase